ncbi:hypothetical protein A2778_05560 [Candidatus Daviesbacteria bacterium RIFCSPHIGHO2_01_FULL_40_24]|uniref:Uncharacterized protein n=1 Tax=Candidatus Daviesbacteria bacterium GW2011_GWC2_40_12 TaxID=1618431 RepID=A0A0G0QQT5_9BACT|nr:MAG: hypothetical protein UT04_C0073G0003 [Candidatus Daviesbacteria bacterium GW2011_GWF2_38_7]KKR17421.1 MAG: hypothetical protein UT45_C0001G0096 [Candidatus Daviesbacteria bacterium GW2011_GWA2_39_33]KKR42799.1 MAG: hypothetical protein UT77_C0001G0250 [Candidatus Daviesbacteria bacterium GW2011_GWC2_40_12]OGE21622.1 MAG: hypothetical protein A2778_05560 [Candidatus Daviesbacteria bacterium RIFCSPHIGHO2_01_FULL_40_24]OGE30019.1 MAG: hypothetical protein A3C29_01265 [Candidatus Daviesbact
MSNNERKALKLLKTAAQHLRKVLKMVEQRRYYLDIIHESQVVQKYLRMSDEEILSGHLKRCVKKILGGENKDQQFQEMLLIFKKGHR